MSQKPKRVVTPAPKHPCTVAFEAFQRAHPGSFTGGATGIFLKNRLQEAFEAGWMAHEQHIIKALGR